MNIRTLGIALVMLSAVAAVPAVGHPPPKNRGPIITSISPNQGPWSGGNIVTITGHGFTGSKLEIDHFDINPVSQSDTKIVIKMPGAVELANDPMVPVVVVRKNHTAIVPYKYIVPDFVPTSDLPGLPRRGGCIPNAGSEIPAARELRPE